MKKEHPVSSDAVLDSIKLTIQGYGKCHFTQTNEFVQKYCHFIYDPGCSYFGRLIGFDKDMKRNYNRCEL
jgi:hypothetical protein